MRQAAAKTVTRFRALIASNSEWENAESFQVPALKNQNGAAQRHCGIKERVKRVLQDELSTDGLLMGNRSDHIQG
jgi:hypothetical protein